MNIIFILAKRLFIKHLDNNYYINSEEVPNILEHFQHAKTCLKLSIKKLPLRNNICSKSTITTLGQGLLTYFSSISILPENWFSHVLEGIIWNFRPKWFGFVLVSLLLNLSRHLHKRFIVPSQQSSVLIVEVILTVFLNNGLEDAKINTNK